MAAPQALQAGGGIGVYSLCVDLDRRNNALTNNLRYAIHYSAGDNSALYLNLLDTNAAMVAENMFGNLLTASNDVRYVYIPAEEGQPALGQGIQSNDAVLLLNIPTAEYPDAAVIQLAACHSRESGNPVPSETDAEIFIYENLLYIDEDGDYFTAEEERRNGTSDYFFNGNGGGISNYDEYFNTGSSTNCPGGGGGGGEDGGGGEPGEEDEDQTKKGTIYVDQALDNDTFTGRSPSITANKGPKKTVHAGLSIAETKDTIIIRPGNYNENLNIQGKDVKVFIEGKVRL